MEHYPFFAVTPLFPVYPEPESPSSAHTRWIMVQGNSVFFQSNSEPGTILMQEPVPKNLTSGDHVYLGTCDDLIYYAVEIAPDTSMPAGWQLSGVRELSEKVPDNEVAIASYAVRILDFHRSTAFCGICGTKTNPVCTERARICPSCSRTIYPRISPAIIVLIKKDEEILLAHSPRFPSGFYSVIAGFNEPGENLEQTIHREVREEVGISVKNIRYFASEPWPFPDSLMIGFVADYAGGEIQIDKNEIDDAGWYTRDTLPEFPSKVSISRALIDAWIRREI
ncbi:NAD(+) diphosphatase [uncultured Methanospirillum sp.]|uniref:NAD(+) diphosphatase n=1 Tax=uncultured Methanospirillum sp. TaxID=262503 RepID=UPI0029C8D8D3|nr:NAD(+) diphosphatase [uncultured Methanospirillum sp.]